MNPLTLDVNNTTLFLLPMLFPDSTHTEVFSNYLKKAYLGLLNDTADIGHTILLEFDPEVSTPIFMQDFLIDLPAQGNVLSIDENLMTLTILDKDIEDYEKFLQGKYSDFSKSFITNILNFWNEDEDGLLYGILNKKEDLVEKYTPYLDKELIEKIKEATNECWPPPDIFEEELLAI